ncbi:hypothetical protein GCM10027343_32560 [Noviherbaspirillum agri]
MHDLFWTGGIMLTFGATRPVLIGQLAVYAPDLDTARQAYAVIELQAQTQGFGTVTLDNGEQIDWVDMRRAVGPSYEECRDEK